MKAKKTAGVLAGGVLLAVFLLASGAAYSDQTEDEAKTHYKQGVALFAEENYKSALGEFLKSFELKPNWKLRITIGICYFNLGRFIEAHDQLLAYLEEGGQEVLPEKKTQAEDLLAQVAKLMATVKFSTNVEGASITIDGKEIGKTPMKKSYGLEAGLYKVKIEAGGYEPFIKDINVAGGDSKEIEVNLIKKTDTTVKPPEGGGDKGNTTIEPVPKNPPDTKGTQGDKGAIHGTDKGKAGKDKGEKKPKKKLDKLAIGAIATGALTLGGGIAIVVVGLQINKKSDELGNCKEDRSCQHTQKEKDLVHKGNTLRGTLNYGLIPITAALGITSIALGVVSALKQKKAKSKEKTSTSLLDDLHFGYAPDPTGAGLITVGGKF